MNKKWGVIAIIVLLVFLTGCLNYKSYDLPKEDGNEQQLVSQLAQLEQELSGNAAKEEIVEKDVVLPELSTNPQEEVNEEEMQTITVQENSFVKIRATIVDEDKDPITTTYSKPLNNNGEWKTSYGDAGEYVVTLSATDGKLTTVKNIKLIVERVNVHPSIEGVKDITIREGETVTISPVITDPNNDKVSVVISEPLKEGAWKTDHLSAGEYHITVKASDGELETEQAFTLTVQNVNVVPVMENVEDIVVKEGELVVVKPTINDLDNDPITVTISDPLGDDGIWETSFTDHGEYMITVSATDGKDTITKKIHVIVEDVNVPPKITDISVETS